MTRLLCVARLTMSNTVQEAELTAGDVQSLRNKSSNFSLSHFHRLWSWVRGGAAGSASGDVMMM